MLFESVVYSFLTLYRLLRELDLPMQKLKGSKTKPQIMLIVWGEEEASAKEMENM